MASLDDLIATCSPRFKPRAIYIEAADCLQVYIHPGATVRRRVDDIMTFYEDPESKKLTGCMVKGVKRLVQELGGFGIDVFDADGLRIKMVFWAYTLAKKDEGIPEPDQPLFRELVQESDDLVAAAA